MYQGKNLDEAVVNDLFKVEEMGAKGFIHRQVTKFLDELDDHLSAIDFGIQENDFETIRHHAHKLNGFSGTIGASKIRNVAIKIEADAISERISMMPDLLGELKDVCELLEPELKDIAGKSYQNSQL